jgi:23S rRNA-intervening sequence protein
MMPYERLTAWKAAHELVLAVYRATEDFPKHEMYGLTSQLRRGAFSIAANIAEGSAKRGNGEFRRFLDIAIAWRTCARERRNLRGAYTRPPDAR